MQMRSLGHMTSLSDSQLNVLYAITGNNYILCFGFINKAPPHFPPVTYCILKYRADILDDSIPTVHQLIREDNAICFIIQTQGF